MTKKHEDLKNEIVTNVKEKSTLIFPNWNKKFILQCDASDIGIGCILLQEDGVIGYYSKKLSGPELNYSIVEKELYSIIKGLDFFRNLIQGFHIEINTDSLNCTYMNKQISSRFERWKLLLNEFDFELKNIEGRHNQIADALSRCFKTSTTEKVNDNYIERVKDYAVEFPEKVGNNERVIIENSKIKDFLNYIHEKGGHTGITVTYKNIRRYFKITNIFKNIKEIIKECTICNLHKNDGKKIKSNVRIISNTAFEKISSDIYGPFPLDDINHDGSSEKGYFITITDIYSKISMLKFTYTINTKKVIRLIDKWITTYGIPKTLISDNGTQYTSNLLSQYLIKNKINHNLIPPYHPSSNGISERINKILAETISMHKESHITAIKNMIEHRLNENYNRTIHCSPRELITGISYYDPYRRVTEYARPLMSNPSHISKILEKGMKVYKKNLPVEKSNSTYSGPYTIVEVGKKQRWCKLENDNYWTHIDHLKF